ncbi:serine/arginine repetitive matrix protein 1-like [Hyposmocoma kahamanoa]|uniref:serine/arginine repetitive matrix protein 1-like n=1 Tax=Hyposmocoma kahamanoa TaxID=1477025 RepID=UPI000E6D5F85|nr:serine/arginine repetitive matrix protein 1-like [Hyposmocoma kahamanoa]
MEQARFENGPQAGPRKGESRPSASAGGSPSYSGGGKNCLVGRPEVDPREHEHRTRTDNDFAHNLDRTKASNVEVRILSDNESEGETMLSASSDGEPTLSKGNSRAVSRSGSAGEKGSSRAAKRAAPPSNEPQEPERAPKISTARRGRPRVPGKTHPGPAAAGRGRSSSAEWNALQKETDAAFFKEALKRPGKAGEAEPEGTAGIMSEVQAQEARDGLATILAETAKSSNLKGTVIKAIKEAVKKVERAIDSLHLGETATEAARRMSEDNRQMRRQLAALEAEFKALRGAYSTATAKAKAQVAPPPSSSAVMHAGVREAIDDLRRDIFSSMRNMMDARLGDIERRLPAESLRPPLGGRSSAPASEATPAATAIAAAAPRLLPSAAAPESTPGLSPARNAPTDPRPNKKAKRKAPPPKATAAPPAAPLAVPAVRAGPDMAASMPTDHAETPWSQVVGRKARKAKTAAAAIQAARAPAKAAPKTAPRPRALATPKSSAVVITLRPEAVAEKGVTYKGVLEAATAAVDLGSLGIPHVRVRNTQTGARIVEVPGATSAEKADTLAAKLEEVIGGLAAVTRPTKTADLRVTGFDESVTPEKIRAVVAAKGQCPQSAVSVGAVRLAPNGRGSALVRCPVTAAQRVAAAGCLLVGWSSAGVHVMEPLPMRCFRCMGIGHTRALCPSSVDRSGLCFRCGQVGHSASGCTATARCSVCTAARRPADHVMGGRSCAPPPHQGQAGGDLRPPPY